ncbi:MAG: TonB-dependent receptor [Gammaproteobacteria bacterium]|nr:TonB-dependent receptor [Gammaproteobacteria bacterium]
MLSLVRFRACVGLASIASLPFAAAAVDTEFALTEADFYAPMPTVLSAARLVQPLSDAPVAMTVIDREMIQASSAVDVPGLLRLVPGFQVSYTEGVDAVTTYHGYADHFPRRMQVLVDGRPVYNPGINGVVWSALPLTLDEIERIEVVRGANAAAYGSNAFLGTINVITRSPESVDRAMLRAMGGSGGHGEAAFAVAGQSEQLAYSVNASYAGNDGFADKFDSNRSRLFNFRGAYHPTADDTVRVHVGMRQTDFDSEAFRVPRERVYRSDYQQLVWERLISDGHDIRVQAYHNAFDSPDDVTFTDPGSGLLLNVDYTLSTDRYDLEFQHRWSPAADWRISWGAGVRHDRVSGAGVFDTDGDLTRDMSRLFANVEWHARPDLTVNGGVMGEHFDDLGGFLSPRLALNWKPAARHTLRLSAARAYRMPTILEQHGEVKVDLLITPNSPDLIELLGTPDNGAERINSFEIGYLVDLPAISGVIDLRLFQHDVDHLLYEIEDEGLPGDPLRFDESGSIRTRGIELQTRFRPDRDSLVHLAYAYARVDGGYVTKIDAAGNPAPSRSGNPRSAEPSVPRHTFTLLGSRTFADGWQLSGTYYYVSAMEWLGEGDFVDRQTRVDARLSKRFRHSDSDVELSLNVQNLFDEPYWEFNPSDEDDNVSGNLAERRIYAQVKVNLR